MNGLERRRSDVAHRLWIKPGEREEDMKDRVASICPKVRPFFDDWSIVPNTPALANAGTNRPMMSACFVFDTGDNIDSIFEAHKKAAIIQKYGGGTGFWFGDLSPAGKPLGSGGTASVMMSFFSHFDHLTDTIKQGGIRRGANMGQIGYDHPEARDFIVSKVDPVALERMAPNPATGKTNSGRFANFNISMRATDEFMRGVEEGSGEEVSLFDLQCRCAWLTGDPGIVFYDTAQKGVRRPDLGPVIATNPCGEQWMRDNEACNLLAINLVSIIKGGRIDWDRYRELIHAGVDYLNAVVDQGWFPVESICKAVRDTRRIGLGIMGLADLLILMGAPYDSDYGRDIWQDLIRFHCEEAREYSDSKGYNNENVTTIAPTGSTSLLAGVNGGLEPYFGFEVVNSNSHGTYKLEHPIVEKCPDPRALVSAEEIHWRDHLAMQSIAQGYVDNAVTKTINLPESASLQDVKDVYMEAWRTGCKGVTVFRDGCLGGGQQVYAKPEPGAAYCPKGGCSE